jgi:hypothetical protein
MSETPSLEELERAMRPGRCSNGGFLGLNESLEDVIAKDEQTLAKFGISYEQIASSIERIWIAATTEKYSLPAKDYLARETDFPCLHKPETIPSFSLSNLPELNHGFIVENFQVFIVQYRGFQHCPWGCSAFGSSDLMILNRKTGESFAAPELIIHLIRAHRFFEGFESPYRVDPKKVIRTLEISPIQSA